MSVLALSVEVSCHTAHPRRSITLRRSFSKHAVDLGPSWLVSQRAAQLETFGTRGLDALDPYFARYLPQLVLALSCPLLSVVAVATQDRVGGGA